MSIYLYSGGHKQLFLKKEKRDILIEGNPLFVVKCKLENCLPEVVQLKRISLLLVLGLAIISLAGCGEVETREKILPDGSKVTVDAAGKILSGAFCVDRGSLVGQGVPRHRKKIFPRKSTVLHR